MNSFKGKLQLICGAHAALWVFVASFCTEPGYLHITKCDCSNELTFFGIVGGIAVMFAIIYGIRYLLYEGAKNCNLEINFNDQSKTKSE